MTTAPIIDVVTPTLWRADRLAAYVENIHDTTTCSHQVTFVAEGDDQDTLDAVGELLKSDESVRLLINQRTKNTTGAYNTAMRWVRAPWWFGSGDDCTFHPQWNEPLLETVKRHPELRVIGTNDQGNPHVLAGLTATHFLVNTEYTKKLGCVLNLEPGLAGFEGYRHNFFDTELVETARERGVWKPCLASVVEHKHWVFGKADVDPTYSRTIDDEKPDRALWAERRKMFRDPQV